MQALARASILVEGLKFLRSAVRAGLGSGSPFIFLFRLIFDHLFHGGSMSVMDFRFLWARHRANEGGLPCFRWRCGISAYWVVF